MHIRSIHHLEDDDDAAVAPTAAAAAARSPLRRILTAEPHGLADAVRCSMPLSGALTTAEAVVFRVELVYFPLLAFIYGVANALRGILNSGDNEDSIPTRATGPGGRPLPSTKQKKKKTDGPERAPPRELEFSKFTRRLFDYGSVCVVLTFVANAAAIASHTIGGENDENWWCGEESAVSCSSPCPRFVCFPRA